MAERLVINTGPLITLGRIGCLEITGQLPFDFICPAQVREELDEGEAAGYPRIAVVAIDEWKGRRAALAAGLEVTGTLGLLGRAKRMGLIPTLEPLIRKAWGEGVRYHPELVRAVLESVGE